VKERKGRGISGESLDYTRVFRRRMGKYNDSPRSILAALGKVLHEREWDLASSGDPAFAAEIADCHYIAGELFKLLQGRKGVSK
jgi:hypothetical protein